MKVYVVSWEGTAAVRRVLIEDGCFGVYSSLEKARRAVDDAVTHGEDYIYDWDIADEMSYIFTEEGTWTIERFDLDDE